VFWWGVCSYLRFVRELSLYLDFMDVGGFLKTSLVDYPGKVSCVAFTVGCSFRCPFCHNRELVLPSEFPPLIPEKEISSFLLKRRAVIDGVVITGGEPTLQADLADFARKIKSLGLLVKLDTNGSNPQSVEVMLTEGLLDYVALDVKAPLDQRYLTASGVTPPIRPIKKTISLLANSLVPFELRTTVVPSLHTDVDVLDMAYQLAEMKLPAAPWYLQQFVPQNCLEPLYCGLSPYREEELHAILEKVVKVFPAAELRV